MIESFEVTQLARIFRKGLLALLPVMDAARIRWVEPGVYDPWENIERTLYSSIIASCVENASPEKTPPLAEYGSRYRSYEARSFISDRVLRSEGRVNAFLELSTVNEPFDVARFSELDGALAPTGRTTLKPLDQCTLDLAWLSPTGVAYRSEITYML